MGIQVGKSVFFDWEDSGSAGAEPASPSPYALKTNNFSVVMQEEQGEVEVFSETGEPIPPYYKVYEVNGDLDMPLSYENAGIFFKALLGDPTTTGAGPYVHTFVSQNTVPSFLTEIKTSDGTTTLYERYLGLHAGQGNLTISPDDAVIGKLSTTGMVYKDSLVDSIAQYNSGTATSLGYTPLLQKNLEVQIDGSNYCLSKNFNITFDNSVEGFKVLCQAKPTQVKVGNPKASGTIESVFDNLVYQKAKQNTEVSLILTYTSGTNILKITFNEVQFSFKTEPKTPNAEYPMSFDFMAYKDDATEMVKVELTNSITSY